MTTERLTSYAKAGGCAAKLSPKILDQILSRVPRMTHENLLVGFETADDAAIYKLDENTALVQTIDFFTPIVDDPETFGAIAAANALSDVWAMGGQPISALTVACFPPKADPDMLAGIIRGGMDKMREAGCVIVGGHSIVDEEVKFGFAVTGLIHPERIWRNAGAQPGDVLLLSKPLGTGVISTALKKGIAKQEWTDAATRSMLTLNKYAHQTLTKCDVHGCTDVTGFGLIGHAREMALGSNVTLEIEASRVPLLPGALESIALDCIPGGLRNNHDFASCVVHGEAPQIFYDPQTSGGLLVALPESELSKLAGHGCNFWQIGRVTARQDKPIHIQ